MNKLQKAKELYNLFTHKTNQKGEVYLCLSNEAQSHPNYPTLLDLINDSNLSTVSSYNFVYEALGLIASIKNEELGLDGDSLEQYIIDKINEMESDVYTSNLTAWLNACAQYIAKTEVANRVNDALNKIITN